MGFFPTSEGGVITTEIMPLIPSQVNVSSIGDTYTDVAGDTYAETSSQTRLTMIAGRARTAMLNLGAHVSTGTGTFQLWNFTDSVELATTATTTSTSEALIANKVSTLDTNVSDAITLRVKNSNAGATVTIDSGGLGGGDTYQNGITSVTAAQIGGLAAQMGHQWFAKISVAVLKVPSTGTLTAHIGTLVAFNIISATATPASHYIGDAFGTTGANTVFTITPTVKVYAQFLWRTAIGASNQWACLFSYEIRADNI